MGRELGQAVIEYSVWRAAQAQALTHVLIVAAATFEPGSRHHEDQ
jgi:hypothetical protein